MNAVTIFGFLVGSKYEEICAPQVEEFCYITDNTYFKDEVWFNSSAAQAICQLYIYI